MKNLSLAVVLLLLVGIAMGTPAFGRWVLSPWLALTVWLAITDGWLAGLGGALVGCLAVALERHLRGWPLTEPRATYALMLAGALYAGAVADGLRRRVRGLRDTVASQAVELVRRRERVQVLEQANAELKVALSEQQSGLAGLYEIFRRLSTGEEGAVLEVVADFLKAEQCSLYRLEGRNLRLIAQRGAVGAGEELVPLGDDLLSEAVTGKRLRSLREFPLERLTGRDAGFLRLMAAPILHPISGQCLGVISVESLPFANFTKPSAELLETIAELAGRSFSADAPPPEYEWLGAELFLRRLGTELTELQRGSRARFSLLWLGAPAWSELSVSLRHLAERALALLLGAHLSPTDLRGRVDGGVVAVLMPDTELEAAEAVARELGRDLSEFLALWIPELKGTQIEVGAAGAEGTEAREALARARAAVRPCTL